MSVLYIGFSRPKTWFRPLSYLIEIFQGVPFTHAYARIHSESLERSLVYQAKGTSVHFVGSKRFFLHTQVVAEYEIEITEEQKKRILQFCVDNAGSGYGVMQLIGMVYVVLARKLFRKAVQNPFRNGFICSEVAALLMKELGIETPVDANSADLLDVFGALGESKRARLICLSLS